MWVKGFIIYFLVAIILSRYSEAMANGNFVQTMGTQFVLKGKPLYFNGFNSYWLMYMAADPSTRLKVTDTFQQASEYGMNVARTWAFSDGGYRPLQSSPGSYNEDMFKVRRGHGCVKSMVMLMFASLWYVLIKCNSLMLGIGFRDIGGE